MTALTRALALGLTLGLTACETDAGAETKDLQTALAAEALRHAPAEVAIAYRNLRTGQEILVQGDEIMHAASTMKVPVMIELFRQADAGRLSLSDNVRVQNEFHSIVDGSRFALSPDDDSERKLYQRLGSPVPLRELLHLMITRSSNLATNILIERADPKNVQRTIESLGTRKMQVLRGVEDQKAYRQGRSNTATARDLMLLMAAIAEGKAASPQACRQMIEILTAQEFNQLIPAGLPKGTRVAHKTGSITGIRHDAAIVLPENQPPYVLVVLTRGFAKPDAAAKAIQRVARTVHELR